MIKDVPKLINSKLPSASTYDIWAWVLAGLALFFILYVHLLSSLLAGLLVYELVHIITPFIARKFPSKQSGNRSKLWAIAILVFVIVSLLALAGAGL
ncbi:MAG: hypothetical protein H0W85_08715, partial [Methylotenera sp.]|nr:hypothetical protein [Methylotenera sp.]